MGLEKVSDILKMADEANTSVIAFNCTDYNTIYSVITVAEELKKPVLCMLYPEHAQVNNCCSIRSFADTVRSLARNVKVPIGIHLDHCSDEAFILNAVKDGFTSVMFDGSSLPVEENIARTRALAEQVHKLGADLEAELGQVGFAAAVDDQKNTDKYTKPDVAAYFCEKSMCDSVAIAIGSAHGFYKETPKLDLQRLKEINAATDVPLVLHGGSGIPEDQLHIAFREGINKFNVGTEFFWLYWKTTEKFCADSNADFFQMPKAVQSAMMEYLCQKMQLCTMTI